MKPTVLFAALLFLARPGLAEELKPLKDVPYGSHPRQVLDFYPAKSDKPTPVVFYIHGGGWRAGDKKTNPKAFLDKGISVVAINYRYVAERRGRQSRAAGESAAGRCGPGSAVRPLQGQGMEPRQDADRRDGRLGRGVFFAVAGVSR